MTISTMNAPVTAPRRKSRLKAMTPLQTIGVILLCAVGLVYLYPLFWLADSSFRPGVEIFQWPPTLFRDFWGGITGYTVGSYAIALGKYKVGWAFGVSVFVTLSCILLTLL